jgi:hypothetical protein
MHINLRARHSLAMHFATFAGSENVALEPIVELEQAKRAMEMVTGVADHWEARMRERGDWWMEGGMGVIDIGTAVVHILARRLRARNLRNDNVLIGLRYSRYTPFASYSMSKKEIR